MSGLPGAYITFWEDFLYHDNVTAEDLNETVGSSAVQAPTYAHGGWWRQSNDGGDADDCLLTGSLVWEVDEGQPLVAETRVKNDQVAASAATGSGIFFGMTDAITESNGINPIHAEAATLTTTATDAFGLLLDESTVSGTTNLNWYAAGVRSDVDTSLTATTGTPLASAGVAQVLRLVATTANSGTVRAYVGAEGAMGGGNLGATLTSAFNSATVLCVALGSDDRGDDADTDWDYIYVSAPRT